VKQKSKRKVKKSIEVLPKEELLIKLGERIKQMRIEKGYSSYEYFAYDHNISRSQFGRYERGEDLRFSSLVKVANAFGLSLEEFFKDFE
jgi:transcriptional regulator with XRE-family HTH domain